jgi:hypothetical protein
MGPSDRLRLVTRDWRCPRLSHRYRSRWWAASEAVGSPTSTKVPLSACCGSAPRKSPHKLTRYRFCRYCLPVWGTRSASSTTIDVGAMISRSQACSGPQTPCLRFTQGVTPAGCKTRCSPVGSTFVRGRFHSTGSLLVCLAQPPQTRTCPLQASGVSVARGAAPFCGACCALLPQHPATCGRLCRGSGLRDCGHYCCRSQNP